MLVPDFLSLVGSNLIWSILGSLIELMSLLHYRHLSLNQVMKLSSLDEHGSLGYEEPTEWILELLPSKLCV